MSFRSLKGWSRGFVSVLLLTIAGCGFPGGNHPGGGGSGGGGGFGAKAPTLLNLADAAPDRVIALSLHISDITMHQTSGASLTALNHAGGLTVEMTHRQALFEPINLDTTDIAQGTYDSVIITLSSAGTVTWVDDLGVIRQDVAPTITSTPVTVPLAANLIVSTAATPVVLNVQFLPSSVAIDTGTNHATITPAYTVTATPANATTASQTELDGLVRQITGKVVATPAVGATTFQISSSQLANPLTINTDGSTTYTGDLAAFSDLTAGNIVQVRAVMVTATTNLLAKIVEGENAGVGATTGGDIQGVITTAAAGSIRVQNVATTGAAPAIGSNVAITDTSATIFEIDQQDVDLSNLPFAGTFDAAHAQPGQDVSAIYSDISTTGAPRKLKLKLQTLPGTVGAISNGSVTNQNVFPLTLPLDSYFALLTGQTSVTVIWQPSTVATAATPTPGNPIHVRGLLFFDTVSSSYFLVADQFTP